jgi:hypothetical protein
MEDELYLQYALTGSGSSPQQRAPDGKERKVEVMPKVVQEKRVLDLTQGNTLWQLIREAESDERLNRHRYAEFGEMLMVWKRPEFDMADDEVDRMANQLANSRPWSWICAVTLADL